MNNNLSLILKKKDRSVSFLKRNTNITRYSLDKIIKGEKSPTLNQAKQIAKALNILVSEIFFGKNERKSYGSRERKREMMKEKKSE